jgi:hypothetical protein
MHQPGITYAVGETYAEDCDEDESVQCSRGLHVATMAWCLRNWRSGWRLLRVRVEPGDIAAIPLGTDGKFRVRKLTVIAEVPITEWGEGPWSPREPSNA